jgi:DNA-binding NtrC family response regulator
MEPAAVLVVDDEPMMRELLEEYLTELNYRVVTAESGAEAIELVRTRLFDAVLTDLRMPGVDGLELLREVKRHDPAIAVVLMTAAPAVNTAVEALKAGAYDYLVKPLNLDELAGLLSRLAERSFLRREVNALRTQLGEQLAVKELIGASPAMERVKEVINTVAPTDSPVLIEGESGTGKELVAAAIHRLSARAKGPFVPVNCSSIPTELLESELFGHVRGAFSGAVADAVGLFPSAHGGTIFLDEVVELPLSLQVKLLRVLQEKEVRPVGSAKTRTVDARVVAATNRHLEDAVRDGALRQDLFYRLNVVRIVLPPLRERRADIPALVANFLRRLNARFHREVDGITPEAMDTLKAYDFPGNVRELENLLESAYALGAHGTVKLADLPALSARHDDLSASQELLASQELPPLSEALAQVERELILRALRLHSDDREKAARALCVSLRTFYRRLKEHKLL